MTRCLASAYVVLSLCAVGGAAAPVAESGREDPDLRRTQDAYQAVRPADRDLGVFALDWAGSLREAKTRAAREKRPIFFVSTMQLKDAGDLRGGHC